MVLWKDTVHSNRQQGLFKIKLQQREQIKTGDITWIYKEEGGRGRLNLHGIC